MGNHYIDALHKVAAMPGTFINVLALIIALGVLTIGITMAVHRIGQRRAEKRAVNARLSQLIRNNRGEIFMLALGIIALVGVAAMVAGAAWPETGTFWKVPW